MTREEEINQMAVEYAKVMLGGNNAFGHFGNNPAGVYYVAKSYKNYITCSRKNENNLIFTLEEFIENFPYKVGDKVLINDDKNVICIADSMAWNEDFNRVVYRIEAVDGIMDNNNWFAHEIMFFSPKKEEIEGKITINEDKGTLAAIDLTLDIKKANEIEVILGDYEFVLKDGKTYFVKKNNYPKTYEECCEVLKIPNDERYIDIDVPLSYNKILKAFTQLLICRDAYWKIAGEQMGLGKPWKPSANDEGETYLLCYNRDSDCFDKISGLYESNAILVFPTEEMCNAFYENFKHLIEECKEFL